MMLLRLLWIFKLVTVQKNPRSRSRQLMFDYIALVQARLPEAHNRDVSKTRKHSRGEKEPRGS
jgi:hypothetical protein